jgi:hypothetical protein
VNRNQKIVGIICTLALVAMCIYPPFSTTREPGVKLSRGYSFIWDPPSGPSGEILPKQSVLDGNNLPAGRPEGPVVVEESGGKARIDFSTLLIQCLIIVTVRVLAQYALKDSQ